jgi:hypothetical protein
VKRVWLVLIPLMLLVVSGVIGAGQMTQSVTWNPDPLVADNLAPGTEMTYSVTLKNTGHLSIPVGQQLEIVAKGETAPYITITQPAFKRGAFRKGETVSFDVTVSVPMDAPIGELEGKIYLARVLPNGRELKVPHTDSLPVTVEVAYELVTFPATLPPPMSEEEKMALDVDANRPYRYLFDNPVMLYVADGPGRPTTDEEGASRIAGLDRQTPSYTNAFHGAFVEKGGDEERWFAYTTMAENVDHVVWQMADHEFVASNREWQNPKGLIAQGREVNPSAEFSFDFSKIIDADLSESSRTSPRQKPYFIRALAIDSQGQVIGEADRGLAVLYGHAVDPLSPANVVQVHPLLTPPGQGNPYPGGDVAPPPLEDYAEHDCGLPGTEPWYFWPQDLPTEAESLYLQVTLSPLSTTNWRDPPGLVYERVLSKGSGEFDALFGGDPSFHSVPVDFLDVAAYEKEYYVRAVALSPGAEVGSVAPSYYSKTVRFVCRPPEADDTTWYVPPEPIVLQAPIPDIKLLQYERLQRQRPDWMYWYEVTRQPRWEELSPIYAGNKQLVKDYTVGKIISLGKPQPDDDSWLSDAWEAIKDFFSDLAGFLEDTYNWVQTAYKDIKSDIIAYAADILPLPPPADDYLEDALTYAVDYGLVSIGIPPELPNFDQLTAQGVDYLAASALDMANIPETEWTKEKIAEIGSGIVSAMDDAARAGDAPNPLNWNFVRQWPGGLGRPAYLLLRVTNPFDDITTAPGIIGGRVSLQLTQSDLGYSQIMTLWSSFCTSMNFELFRPVENIPVPRLPPKTTIEIPIYLKEYTGAAYPWCDSVVHENDFSVMYNYFDDVRFVFGIEFDLPPIEQYAADNNVSSETGFAWAQTNKGFGFVGWAAYSQEFP